MLGRVNSLSGRFIVGGAVIVGVAALATFVILRHAPGAVNDDSGYSIQPDHVHTSRIQLIDWENPPRAAKRSVSVRAVTEGYCVGNERRPVAERADMKESAGAVVVGPATVHEFAVSGSGACAGIGYDAPVRVGLRHPLGDRAVLTSAKQPRRGRTLWPSEDQFQCMRRLGGARADRRLFGAVTRDEIETEKQVAGVLYLDHMWGRPCGVSTP
jgi:hypothetical protein